MGYYSDFEITIENERANVAEICEPLIAISGYSVDYLDDETLSVSDAKWYDWHEDMKKLSKQFPWAAIRVSRMGEESLDWECSLFINGKEFNKTVEYVKPTTLLENDPEVQQAIKDAENIERLEPCSFNEMKYVMIKNGMAEPDDKDVQCPVCHQFISKVDFPKIHYGKDSNDVYFYCPYCGGEF